MCGDCVCVGGAGTAAHCGGEGADVGAVCVWGRPGTVVDREQARLRAGGGRGAGQQGWEMQGKGGRMRGVRIKTGQAAEAVCNR